MVLTEATRERIAAVPFDFERAEKRVVERCNLCGAGDFETVAERDRYGYPARAEVCRRCGLIFLNPMLTAAAYDAFYRHVYRPLVSAYHGRTIDAETVEHDQVGYAEELVATLEPFLAGRAGSSLLDVGGSTGVVADAVARRFGLRATVLEPAPAEAARAEARGLETIVGTIEGYAPGVRRFDVVLLCQTIDHLLDVAGSLAKLRSVTADDGLLFADVVDVRVPMRAAGRVSAGLKVDHPYALTPTTAETFLARAGFLAVQRERAADGLHVRHVCRPAEPRGDALPPAEEVEALRRKLAELAALEES